MVITVITATTSIKRTNLNKEWGCGVYGGNWYYIISIQLIHHFTYGKYNKSQSDHANIKSVYVRWGGFINWTEMVKYIFLAQLERIYWMSKVQPVQSLKTAHKAIGAADFFLPFYFISRRWHYILSILFNRISKKIDCCVRKIK